MKEITIRSWRGEEWTHKLISIQMYHKIIPELIEVETTRLESTMVKLMGVLTEASLVMKEVALAEYTAIIRKDNMAPEDTEDTTNTMGGSMQDHTRELEDDNKISTGDLLYSI